MSSQPTQRPTPAFNDVLAKMMQAEVNEGGPPPATPCDTPVEVISNVHMADPNRPAPDTEEALPMTKQEFEQTLTEHLDQLRDEIHVLQSRTVTLAEAAKAKWHETIADLQGKQHAAREKLAEVAASSGEAWEHLRDGVKDAWNELRAAVRKARSEF